MGIMTMSNQQESILEDMREALREEYGKERSGIHISSLTLCPREQVFRLLRPHELDDKSLMFFTMGSGQHQILQSLLKWFGKKNIQIEKKISYNGVVGHVDAVIKGIPLEIKTTRSKSHEAKLHYLIQLKCYCAILGSNIGKLITVGLINYNEPFHEHTIVMSESEIKKQLEWIDKEAAQFKEAVDKKDWTIARAVKDDKDLNWKCTACVFSKECFDYENNKTKR